MNLEKLGIEGKAALRDMWERRNLGEVETNITVTLKAHDAKLFKLSVK